MHIYGHMAQKKEEIYTLSKSTNVCLDSKLKRFNFLKWFKQHCNMPHIHLSFWTPKSTNTYTSESNLILNQMVHTLCTQGNFAWYYLQQFNFIIWIEVLAKYWLFCCCLVEYSIGFWHMPQNKINNTQKNYRENKLGIWYEWNLKIQKVWKTNRI